MRRGVYGWLLCALGYSPLLHAQSHELEALMEHTIVSTPSKSAESASTAPATSSVITAEELRAHGLRSLDEALNYASLGMITTSPEHAVDRHVGRTVGKRGRHSDASRPLHVSDRSRRRLSLRPTRHKRPL